VVQLNSVVLGSSPVAAAKGADAQCQQARAAIGAAGQYLYELGALSAARTFNAAVRLNAGGEIVVAGFQPRDGREANTAIRIDLTTGAIDGDHDADLREIAAIYVALFNAKPQIDSAVHTRSPHLAAFAVAHRPLPVVYGTGLLKRTPAPVPVAPWTARLSAQPVLAALDAHPLAPALLLGNRGVLAWGSEPIDKLVRFVASLEEVATIAIRAQVLGGARALPAGAYEAM
jgi:ribulose-5-phosphate 4-epimerase/fuculose-1-phosphate aldolase